MGVFVPYRNIDFGVLAVFVLKLLHSLLLLLPLLLVQAFQVLPSLVLLQHLVAFKLLVSLSVVVLQVLGGLEKRARERLATLNSFHSEVGSLTIQSKDSWCLEPSLTGCSAVFHLALYDLTVEMSSSRSLASKVF